MDNRLNFESHINNVCGKLAKFNVYYSRVETISRKMCWLNFITAMQSHSFPTV